MAATCQVSLSSYKDFFSCRSLQIQLLIADALAENTLVFCLLLLFFIFLEALLFPSVSHGYLCMLEWLGMGAA